MIFKILFKYIAVSDFDEDYSFFYYVAQLIPSVASLSDTNNQNYIWIIPFVRCSFITHIYNELW